MIYLLLLAAVLLACGWFALAAEREKSRRALRELEQRLDEKLAKLNAAVATKADETAVRNLSTMLEGGLSISRRIESRVADLEKRSTAP